MGLPDWVQEIPTWAYVVGIMVFMLGYQLHEMQRRLARFQESLWGDLDEVVEWLKEIDPRMEEERQLLDELFESESEISGGFAGMRHMDIERGKEERGERTYMDPLRKKHREKVEEEWKAKRKK